MKPLSLNFDVMQSRRALLVQLRDLTQETAQPVPFTLHPAVPYKLTDASLYVLS